MKNNIERATNAEKSWPLGVENLYDIATILWPNSSISTNSSKFIGSNSHSLEYGVLPSLDSPRLLVPLSPSRATFNAIRNYKASATGASLIKIKILALAGKIGLAKTFASRITISNRYNGIDIHCSLLFSYPISLALYVGPSRAVQKPVLQILSPDGNTVAFAKIAVNDLTEKLIRNEVRSIGIVESAHLSSLVAPRIIDSRRWNERSTIVQEAISPGKSMHQLMKILPSATRQLSEVAGSEQTEWRASPYRRNLLERLQTLSSMALRSQLVELVGIFDQKMNRRLVSFGSWHGDWSPWNMTTTKDGHQVVAWDWEHFDTGVPIGFDAIHFDISRLVVISGYSPAEAFNRIFQDEHVSLTAATIPKDKITATIYLYILEIVTRYLEHDEVSVGGTPMSRVCEWLPQVSAQAVRMLDRVASNG